MRRKKGSENFGKYKPGARAAVIDGFLSVKTLIDLNAYNMDPSDMEELAAEIVATGEHGMFYNVTEFRVNPNPVMGTASTLSVEYEDGDLEHMQQVWERVKAVSESVITPGMREYEIARSSTTGWCSTVPTTWIGT